MNDNAEDELKKMLKEFGDAGKKPSDEPTPAWGGARQQGSVPVPIGFEHITNLGPAVAVHGNNPNIGLFYNSAGLSFGLNKAKTVVLYRDGLAYKSGKENILVWRWDEVAVITTKADFERTRKAYHTYTLTKKNGESLVLDDTLQDVNNLITPVKRNVFALLLPPLTSAYNAGQAIIFGPVTIHRQNGLQMGKKVYRWEDIMDIKIIRGRFTITLRDGKRYEERTASIPNLEMLCRMIGLKFNAADLIYF